MPLVHFVAMIENLKVGGDGLSTWKQGVKRAIEKYIPDGTKAKATTCTNCGVEDGIVFEEGCLKCKHCGNAKCG